MFISFVHFHSKEIVGEIELKDFILLHIGDIHFEDLILCDEPSVPVKIHEPDTLIDRSICISKKNRYEVILESLMQEIQNSISAILVSGDLTTGGNIGPYSDCLEFLRKRISATFFNSTNPKKFFLVPGNHDIDRNKIDNNAYIPKFELIINALKDKMFPEIPCENIKVEKICEETTSSKLLVISVNSCIGCGENKYFPPEIRPYLSLLVGNYEIMDTPLIATEHIDEIIKVVKENNDFLPLILIHHNLLPLKRTDSIIHTDLINSGILREKLLMLNKPILYLHGHIHDDPIEIISSPKYEKSKIICVSAPLLFPIRNLRGQPKFGFNKIRIIPGNRTPIGCEIISYRLIYNEIDVKNKRIPFFYPPKSMALMTEKDKFVLSLLKNDEEIYFDGLESIIKNTAITLENGELENILDRLSWLGLIKFVEDDDDIKMRSMKRLVFL